MKRSGSPTRRTPLRAKTALVGASPLARSSRLTRTALARKRPQRTPEESVGRRLVAARSGGRCEGCGAPGPTEWSHRVARSRGGTWAASNGLALCPADHRWAHDHPDDARLLGWHVRTGHDPATTPVLIAGRGYVLLDASGGITPANRSAA